MQNEKNGGNDEGVASILRNPRLRGFGNYAGSSVRARQEEPEKKAVWTISHTAFLLYLFLLLSSREW